MHIMHICIYIYCATGLEVCTFLASAIICNPNLQIMVRLHHTLHKQVCLILYFGVICIIIYLILIYKHTYTSFLWEEEVDEDLYSPESPLVGCGSDHSD